MFLVATTLNDIPNEGQFFWTQKYYQKVFLYLQLEYSDLCKHTDGIIYTANSAQQLKPALRFTVRHIERTPQYLKIKYTITGTTGYASHSVRSAAKKYFRKKTVNELPYCAIVDDETFIGLLTSLSTEERLSEFERNNNWQGIYNFFESTDGLANPTYYNNAELLNKIAFATAKLAECTENLKKEYPDKGKRTEILKQKKKLRELTITLRKRCIDLDPQNPSYYSNLAYSYYLSATELTTPGGRRDGSLEREANEALALFKKSLELDRTRITDLYRKGILLGDILVQHILYSEPTEDIRKKKEHAASILEESIATLIELVHQYEGLSESEEKRRYKKYYVKALFKLASLGLQKVKGFVNPLSLVVKTMHPAPVGVLLPKEYSTVLQEAEQHIHKCIKEDCLKKEDDTHRQAIQNGFVAGVYKVYLYGKIYLTKYLFTRNITDAKKAEDYFLMALETEFPREQKKQNKLFVLEKLAVLSILGADYKKAIDYLKHYAEKGKYFPDYAAYTLAVAYILNKETKKAEQILRRYANERKSPMYEKFSKLEEFITQHKEDELIPQYSQLQKENIKNLENR